MPTWNFTCIVWGSAFSLACLFVCLFVRALRGKRLELSAPKSVHIIVHGRISACTDPEVKRSKVKVTGVSSAPGVGAHVDTTARACCFCYKLTAWLSICDMVK